jgi:hypothetical protein
MGLKLGGIGRRAQMEAGCGTGPSPPEPLSSTGLSEVLGIHAAYVVVDWRSSADGKR